MHGQVFYELHIGTFTPEGTFDAAARELEELKNLGITVIEIMPVAEFPGRWNQGYDGASLFAPSRQYGDHEALKRFVDKAHRLGLGVVLDVVYNHFGPDVGCNKLSFQVKKSNNFSSPISGQFYAYLLFLKPAKAKFKFHLIASIIFYDAFTHNIPQKLMKELKANSKEKPYTLRKKSNE
jgi:hypothetical protein